ncbi:aryl-sulfate sulfotransferase [Robertkochia sediminum]|uniref:aryl-sulfate sulfotransferase n=1 Tax=Robertkochia sediminum TaxID=2785326 RepID=UPI0019315119|nr:aryl-sulfate sulfotransferase [Robertkochia sediminum]MBL7472496.1 aryl-sulfate sulfotransferase [Robertkochia sediminum]
MNRSRFYFPVMLFAVLMLLAGSCSNDDNLHTDPEPDTEVPPVDDPVDEGDDDNSGNDIGVLVDVASQRQEGYVLVNDPGSNRVYLMNKADGSSAYEWTLPYHLGNDAKLMDDGVLLISMRAEDPDFNFGGYGGILQMIDTNNEALWRYDLQSADLIAHHDVVMLPNGNVLTMLWERTGLEDAKAIGYAGEQPDIYTETLVEIDPVSSEVVWRWDSRDHLVQDAMPEAGNFGEVAASPRKIDINYWDQEVTSNLDNGDLMHANGLAYDEANDLIYMSVNYYSEVWVIDHSTTTEEAAGSEGGNMGYGGDLVYRFGNPSVYRNVAGGRLFYNNHSPKFVPGTDHMLVYMNGNHTGGPSVVYELDLPEVFALDPDADNEPLVVWEYSHPDMYSAKVSGAERLPNGNTLIAVGTFGYWEVTPEKEVVWQFKGEGFFWRGYHIGFGDAALSGLGLN